jgi:hypothetical protein
MISRCKPGDLAGCGLNATTGGALAAILSDTQNLRSATTGSISRNTKTATG